MDKFFICGGNSLNGELDISTSKNAVLHILAGVILCNGEVIIHKFPKYEDTINMLEILVDLGAKYNFNDDSVIIDGRGINKTEINNEKAGKLRSSIFSLGAILSRFKKAKVAYPGGCAIGARPIDIHLNGLKKLGVKIVEKHGYIYCNAENMKSGDIDLSFPSVGATENLMLASVFNKGKTRIYNCAKEPEIVDLANFLNKLGAKIVGMGTDIIEIEGVECLHSGEYTPISDRIIAGTYLIAGAMCRGKIQLNNIDSQNINSLIVNLRNNGCNITIKGDKLKLVARGRPKGIERLETRPFPGFPTDLQPQMVAMLSMAKGTSIVVENMFESRFKHILELRKMGADIIVNDDKTAIIKGVSTLFGAEVNALDLRGGAGVVLAGLVAQGYTTVCDVHHIDRGYFKMEEDLQKLGANIERITKA